MHPPSDGLPWGVRPPATRHRAVCALVVCAHLLFATGTASASGLCPAPTGKPVLQLVAAPGHVHFACDMAGLLALPNRDLLTSLPPSLGSAGVHRWRGVPLRLLAERLGAGPGQTLQLSALNDYTVTIPWSDLVRYDPIVAYQRNGVALSVREKGPTMLIYPFDAAPELHVQQYLNRSIWQIHGITVK